MAKLIGILLVVTGLALAGATVLRLDRDDAAARGAVATPDAAPAGPLTAVALPLAAAVCFASGIVLLVVGAGRWTRPRRVPAPGDAIVDPAAHHKMDHV
ncbi:MAG: hypothetical protein AB7H93_22960 [Vicinamibacterales bacterium]